MPFISKSSVAVLSHTTSHATITTTIYQQAPTAVSSDNVIPAAAIAGGTAGGACLAVVAVLIWMMWGKITKRTARQEKAAAAARLTMRNTVRNAAGFTDPSPKSNQRFVSGPKVKFAADHDAEKNDGAPLLLSRPMPLRGSKEAKRLGEPEKPEPSHVSSSSMHSTETAEQRPTAIQMLLNALGNLETGTRISAGSRTSMWTFLSRSSRGGTRLSQATSGRFSQATSASMYSQDDPVEEAARPISKPVVGIAY
ncbi:hypothetical protein C8J56DRAFT_1055515 [Mycena floridula]|nr:hypothetical protein C8J56DRAFT_1055515 [Mycena floridula]